MVRETRKGVAIHPLTVYVTMLLWNRLSRYCEDNGVTKTFVVERAVMRYLDEVAPDDDRSEG